MIETHFHDVYAEIAAVAPLREGAIIDTRGENVIVAQGSSLATRAPLLTAIMRAHRDYDTTAEGMTANYREETLVFRTLGETRFVVLSLPAQAEGVVAAETILRLRESLLSAPKREQFDFADWLSSWEERQGAR